MIKKIALLILLSVAFAGTAQASRSCPTFNEARATHGKHAWLYWHTERHCWDDRRRTVRRHFVERKREAAIPVPRANPRPAAEPAVEARFEDPPEFNIRWPDVGTMQPERWLRELVEFGR
jgi:hypothetical protein